MSESREYTYIRDVTYQYNADIGLAYSSPCRGLWNIVHIGVQVPGCHEIYVCPTSCLRGVVLTTAEMNAMDRLSTITVGEDNILEGDMEECLQHGVEKIIETLPEKPRMIMIFISCIHHFLAANYQRVYKILREEYPDIDFIDAYMDPIMRRKTPPLPSLTRQMFRVLKPCDHLENQVNFIGSWFDSSQDNDLYAWLTGKGISVKDLPMMHSYDEFLSMQESCANITIHPHAAWAGKDLQLRLNQKWLDVRPSFRYEKLREQMKMICQTLQIDAPCEEENQKWERNIEEKAEKLQKKFGNTPISIDYTAVDLPLEMAVFLLNHGFQVESVFLEVFTEKEDIFNTLQKLKPDLKIYSAENWNMRLMDRKHDGKIVAIGQQAAYFNNTNYFIDIIHGADMYGYRAIEKWLDLLEEAYDTEKDMKTLIQHKGWRCEAR